MLVVDINKRYTMNQIKQHKWIIQGEPYDFLLENDAEYSFTQQERSEIENGIPLPNHQILEQMEQFTGQNKTPQIMEVFLFYNQL